MKMSEGEAKRIFDHAAKHGTRGFTKAQIVAAWVALRARC
jgi:hypothetical protein